jgi:UDP-glucose 4-epimerase
MLNYKEVFAGKNILVTGGAGFIGHHLVEELMACRLGHLYVLDNLSTGSITPLLPWKSRENFTFIEGDITTFDAYDTFDSLDFIFHLAAVVSVPQSFENPVQTHEVNEAGFVRMLQLARTSKVNKFVYASSSAVYGDQLTMPIREDAQVGPLSPYGLSKLHNERYASAFHQWEGLPTMGFRFFNVYGPGQRADSPYSGVISIFMDRMKKGQPITIYGDGQQTRDFVYVKDVVQALMRGATSSQGFGVYNVGTGIRTSLLNLYETVADLTRYKLSPEMADPRKGDILYSESSIEKISQDLGFRPKYSLREGLIQMLD